MLWCGAVVLFDPGDEGEPEGEDPGMSAEFAERQRAELARLLGNFPQAETP